MQQRVDELRSKPPPDYTIAGAVEVTFELVGHVVLCGVAAIIVSIMPKLAVVLTQPRALWCSM